MLGGVSSRRVLVAASLLVGSAGLGWLAGHVWWRWWSPAPDGVVYQTSRGLRWIADPVDAGSAQLFSATAEFVVIGMGLGLLVGLVVGFLSRGWELVGLATGLLAAGVAAWIMLQVGTDLSPPDPEALAERAGAGATLPGAMQVAGWSPYVAWPAGALAGQLAVILMAPHRVREPSPVESVR